jgi:hypothetical protein
MAMTEAREIASLWMLLHREAGTERMSDGE